MSFDDLIHKLLTGTIESTSFSAIWEELDKQAFIQYLFKHKIAGVVGAHLLDPSNDLCMDAQSQETFQKHIQAIKTYNRMARHELQTFVQASDTKVYLLKGIEFELVGVYGEGERAVGDLDVVIPNPMCVHVWNKLACSELYLPQEYLPSALHQRLLSARPSFEHHHLPALRSRLFSMLTVEIHPQVFNPSMALSGAQADLYRKYSLLALADAQEDAGIKNCYHLSPEVQLLFVCLHLNENRVGETLNWRMLCDVYFYVKKYPMLNWDSLLHLAEELSQTDALIRALLLVNAFLPLDCPLLPASNTQERQMSFAQLKDQMGTNELNVSLGRRLTFYLRYLNLLQALIYIFRTLFPERIYFSVSEPSLPYLSALWKHFKSKLLFFIRS